MRTSRQPAQRSTIRRDHTRAAFIAFHLIVITILSLRLSGDIRATLNTIASPYTSVTGTHQRWAMFPGILPDTHRLEIAIRENDQWSDIYIARSDEADWQRRFWDNDRVRGIVRFSITDAHSHQRHFAPWVIAWVAREHPTATRVRVAYRAVHIPDPEVLRETHELETGDLVKRFTVPVNR